MERKICLLVLGLFFIIGNIFFPLPVFSDLEDELQEYQQLIQSKQMELKTLQEEIQREEAALNKFKSQERSTLTELENLDRRISVIQKDWKELTQKLEEFNRLVESGTQELKNREEEISRLETLLAQRWRSLYKRGDLGYLEILLGAENPSDFTVRVRLLQLLIRQDRDLLQQLRAEKEAFLEEQQALEQRRENLILLRGITEETQRTLKGERDRRARLLSQIRAQRDNYNAMLKEQKASFTSLQEFLQKLELKRKELETEIVRQTEIFDGKKTKLIWPVRGKIGSYFGKQKNSRFEIYTFNQGIEILVAEGTAVKAVSSGQVEFADWQKGYGKMMIISHPGGYYTLYGHLSEILCLVGQKVKEKETIAYSGSTGSVEGSSLFFAICKGNLPLDPLDWLEK
jgi:septal ring factor EnvC (AmiA/AmiB activator)